MILIGLGHVMVGLSLFRLGLKLSLLGMGSMMAEQLANLGTAGTLRSAVVGKLHRLSTATSSPGFDRQHPQKLMYFLSGRLFTAPGRHGPENPL